MKRFSKDKICTFIEAHNLVNNWKKGLETIVFTNGVFDLFHRGHLLSMESAAQLGSKLIVGVNSDSSVRTLNKGTDRPIHNEIDRANVIAGLEVVDIVVIFEQSTPLELIKLLCPNVLVKGADYALDKVVGREFVDRVERIPLLEGYSTSNLIKKIKLMNE